MRRGWHLKVEDSPICLQHHISNMKVLDELSFSKQSNFTMDDVKTYFNNYVKHHNRSAEFTFWEYQKGTVKYRVIRVK